MPARLEQAASLAIAMAGLAALALSLSLLGGLWTIEPHRFDHYADWPLLRIAILYAGLGVVVAFVQWTAGCGVAGLVMRGRTCDLPRLLVYGFPLGMLAAILAYALFLIDYLGGALSALWLSTLCGYGLWRISQMDGIARLARSLALIVPAALIFALWLTLYAHGPTDTLAAYAGTDTPWYVSRTAALSLGEWPTPNLNYEGTTIPFVNSLWSAEGALLMALAGIDPFHFVVSSGAAAFVTLTGVALWAVFNDATAPARRFNPVAALLILAPLTATHYVTWVTQSPPLIFVNGVVLTASVMIARLESDASSRRFEGRHAVLTGLGAIAGPLLAKVVTLGALVPLAATSVIRTPRDLLRLPPLLLIAAGVFAFSGLAITGYLFAEFSGGLIRHLSPRPRSLIYLDSWGLGAWKLVLRDVSTIILAAGYLWLRPNFRGVSIALVLGVALFFPNLLTATIVASVVFIAADLWRSEPRPAGPTALIGLAIIITLPQASFGDPGGTGLGLGWIAGLGVAMMAAADPPALSGLWQRVRAAGMVILLASMAIGAIASATGKLPVRSGHWSNHDRYPALWPETRDIWRAVDHCLPRDSLVFTGLAGEAHSVEASQNTYAQVGRRPIYIAGHVQTREVKDDRAVLAARWAVNDEVLAGARDPAGVPVQGTYQVHARVAASAPPLPWRLIYENDRFSLAVWPAEAAPRRCDFAGLSASPDNAEPALPH